VLFRSAFPRIHNAVSRALDRQFSTIYVPRKRNRPARSRENTSDKNEPSPPNGREVLDKGDDVRTLRPHTQDISNSNGKSIRGSNPATTPSSRGSRCDRDERDSRDRKIDRFEDDTQYTRQPSSRHAASAPKVFRLPDDPSLLMAARHDPSIDPANEGQETIGDRLRGKYERAVHAAAETVANSRSKRGDRGELVRNLVDRRMMIPDEDQRTPLRRIARDTKSSYARVAQCEKQLRDTVRERLDTDPEFQELQRSRRECELGTRQAIDEPLERRLAHAAVEGFIDRLSVTAANNRAQMIGSLLDVMGDRTIDVLGPFISDLPPDQRERLVPCATAMGK